MSIDNNPYAPPTAGVEDQFDQENDTRFIPGGRTREMSRGAGWFAAAWEMFKQAPGMWVLLMLVFLAVSTLINIIPLVNFVGAFLSIVLSGGIAFACDQQRQHGELKIGDLFAGFQQNFTKLLLVALLYMGFALAIILVCTVVFGIFIAIAGGGSAAFSAMMAGQVPHLGGLAIALGSLFLLVFITAMLMLVSAIIFAPSLVMLQGLAPFEAMKQSFSGCWRNMGSGFIYCVVGFVLAILATIPLGLGWIVLIPVTTASIYCAYRDIYFED